LALFTLSSDRFEFTAMTRQLCCCAVALLALVASITGRATASEPTYIAVSIPPAVELHRYIYVEFPRLLDGIDNEIALAERTVVILRARVAGYRPFRSFDQYGATYMADQFAQLDLLAAEQRLARVQRQRDDLWRQRQMMAAWLMLPWAAPQNGEP
jgi:hypothetical protein